MWRTLAAAPQRAPHSSSAGSAHTARAALSGAPAIVCAVGFRCTAVRFYNATRRATASASPRFSPLCRQFSSHAPIPPAPAPPAPAHADATAALSATAAAAAASPFDSSPAQLLPSEAHLQSLQALEYSRQSFALQSALLELSELEAHSYVLANDGRYAGAEQCAMLQRLDSLLLEILSLVQQDGARYAGSRLTLRDYRSVFAACAPRRTAWPVATALHPDLPPPLQRHAEGFARLLIEQIEAANEEEKLQLQSASASSATSTAAAAAPADPAFVSSSIQLVRVSDVREILSQSAAAASASAAGAGAAGAGAGASSQIAEGLAQLFRTGSAAGHASSSAAVVHLSSALAAPSYDDIDAVALGASPLPKAAAPPRTPSIVSTPAEIERAAAHASTKAQMDALLATISSLYNKRDLALRDELHKFRAPLSQSSAFRSEARRLLQSVLDLVPLVPASQHRTFVLYADYRRLLEVSRDFDCLDLSAQFYPRILQQQELSAKMHAWRYAKLRRAWESDREYASKVGVDCPPEPVDQPPLVPFYLIEMLLSCVGAAPQTRDEHGVAQGGPEAVQRLLEHMSHSSVRPKLEQLEAIPQAALVDLSRASASASVESAAEQQNRITLLKSMYAKATADVHRCTAHTHKSMFLALASHLDLTHPHSASSASEADVALLDRCFDLALSDTLNKEAVDEALLERGVLTVLERLESASAAAAPALQQRLLRRADAIWAASKSRSLVCAPLLEGVLRCYALVGDASAISTMLDRLADGVVSEALAASHLRLGALAPLVSSPLAFAIVFRSMARAERPELYTKNAQELYEVMHTRHEKALAHSQRHPLNIEAADRARELDPKHTIDSAYMAYTRRAWSGLPLLARWHLMGFRQKERNLSVLLQLLHSFILGGLHNHAVRLVDQYQRDGHTLRAPVLAAWVAAYIPGGHAAAAEAVWQGMTEVGLKPNTEAYRALFQVYMHTREASQISKIEPAYTEMIRAPQQPPLAFTFQDLEILARTAANCGLEQEAVIWLERAEAIAPRLPVRPAAPVATPAAATKASATAAAAPAKAVTTVAAVPAAASAAVPSKRQQKREMKAVKAAARASGLTELAQLAAAQPSKSSQPAASSSSAPKSKQEKPKPIVSTVQRASRVAALLEGDALVASASASSSSSAPTLSAPATPAPAAVAAVVVAAKAESPKSEALVPKSAAAPGIVPPHKRHAFHSAMKSLSATDAPSKALELVAAFEREGGQISRTVYLIWLAYFTRQPALDCDWKAAQQVWAKMLHSGLAPTSAAYRAMMHVYMVATSGAASDAVGSNLHAQIDALEGEMLKSDTKLELLDLQYLLKTAHKLKLDSEVARWMRYVQQQRPELAEKMDQTTQAIIAKATAAATASVPASTVETAPAAETPPATAKKSRAAPRSSSTDAAPSMPRAAPSSAAARAPVVAASKQVAADISAVVDKRAEQRRKLAEKTTALLQGSPEDAAALAASSTTAAQLLSSAPTPVSDSASVRAELKICFALGDFARAERVVRAFEARGGRPDVGLFNLWLSSHIAGGEWHGAEGVWARMMDQKIEPDRVSFCSLAQVYMRNGRASQLAKIDALISHMRHAHLNFALSDYQRLIKSAHDASLSAEVRRWSNLARAAGLFEKLDEVARAIADTADLQSFVEQSTPTRPAAAPVKASRAASAAKAKPQAESVSNTLSAQPSESPAVAAPALTLPDTISPEDFSKLNQYEKAVHMRASRAAFRKQLESLLCPSFNEASLAQMDAIHAAQQSLASTLDRKFLFDKKDFRSALRLARQHLLADAARKLTLWVQQAGFAEHMDEASMRIMREVDVWATYEKGSKGKQQLTKKKVESKVQQSKQQEAAIADFAATTPPIHAAAVGSVVAPEAPQQAAPAAATPASPAAPSAAVSAASSTNSAAVAVPASLPSAPGVLNFLSQLSARTASWRAADAAALAASNDALRTSEWHAFYEECSLALLQFRSFLDAAPYSPSRQFVSGSSWGQLFRFMRDHKLAALYANQFAQECVKQLVDALGRVERLARIQGKPMPSVAAQKMPAEVVQSMIDALVAPVEVAVAGASPSSGVDAAARLLVQLHAHSLRAHVDLHPEHFVSVLRALSFLIVPAALDFDEALAKTRAYYLSIPAALRTAPVHQAMLEVYTRHGMEVEALALEKSVASETGGDVGTSNHAPAARLEAIYIELQAIQQQLKSQQAPRAFTPAPAFAVDLEATQRKRVALIQESLDLWAQIKSFAQARSVSVEVVCTVLRILRSAGDIPAQVAVIDEALALESESSVALDLASPQPVFVDATAYGILIDSCGSARDSYEFIQLARAAWVRMHSRHSEARSRKQLVRAHQLEVSSHVRQSFLRFWIRTNQLSDLLAVWELFSSEFKRAHPAAVIPVFNSLAYLRAEAEVEAVVADLDAAGAAWTVQTLTAWIAVYKHSGHTAAAERVWERMQHQLGGNSKVAPTSLTYSTMMQVYLAEGSDESLAKLESLYAQSQSSPRTSLQGADYAALLKACHALRLGDQARVWAERAQEAGQWSRLDEAARQIANRVTIWEGTPRAEPLTEEQRREAQIVHDAAEVVVTSPASVPRTESTTQPFAAAPPAPAASDSPVGRSAAPPALKKKKSAAVAAKAAVAPQQTRATATTKVAMMLNGASDQTDAISSDSSANSLTSATVAAEPVAPVPTPVVEPSASSTGSVVSPAEAETPPAISAAAVPADAAVPAATAAPTPTPLPPTPAVTICTPAQAFDEMASLLSHQSAPQPAPPANRAKPTIVVPSFLLAAIEEFSMPPISASSPSTAEASAVVPASQTQEPEKLNGASPLRNPRRRDLPVPPTEVASTKALRAPLPPIKKAPSRSTAAAAVVKKSVIGSSSVPAPSKLLGAELLSKLNALAVTGDTIEAARLVALWEAASPPEPRWTRALLNAWLGVFKRSDDQAGGGGVERVWALFAKSGVQPNAASYRIRFQSLMRSNDAANIDALLASMPSTNAATGGVFFSAKDYGSLILSARALDRPKFAALWKTQTDQRGLTEHLSKPALRVLQHYAENSAAAPAPVPAAESEAVAAPASSPAVEDAPAASSGGLSWFSRLFSAVGVSSSDPAASTAAVDAPAAAAAPASVPAAPAAETPVSAAAPAPIASKPSSPSDSLSAQIDVLSSPPASSSASSASVPSARAASKPSRRRAFSLALDDAAAKASSISAATMVSSPSSRAKSTRPRAFVSGTTMPSSKSKAKRAQARQMHTAVERERESLSLWTQLRLWAGMRG